MPVTAEFNGVTTQPSAPPADLYRNTEGPTEDRPDGTGRAVALRAGTPIPEMLARLMSTSRRLARETQEL